MPPLFIFVAAVVAIFVAIVAIVAVVAVTAVGLFAHFILTNIATNVCGCVCGCKREGGMSRARESGDRLTFHMGSDRLWDYVITGSRKLDAEA